MERMFRLLNADEIECRVSTFNAEKGLSLLLYKDARVDQNILDETVGPDRWQRRHELINGNLFCNVGIEFTRKDGGSEWVWKQDVGTESYTEKEKGQASDSFKRACFNWGIGRELYTAPFIWITPDKFTTSKGKNGPTTFDRFDVTGIEYTDGIISWLEITNTKKKAVVYTYGRHANPAATAPKPAQADNVPPEPEKPRETAPAAATAPRTEQPITAKQVLTLKMICKHHNMPEEKVYGQYGHESMEQMTIGDWVKFGKTGQDLLNAWDQEHKAS